MEQRTMTLREILDDNIEIFDGSYPIFDETYRPVLEKQIKDYYYFREIGVETAGQFVFYLNQKLRLIMPYYNEMYKTTKLDMEILDNYRITETYTNDVTNNNKVTNDLNQSQTTTDGRITKFSDSPQSRVNLSDASFLTNLTDESDNTTNNIDNTGTVTTDNTNHEHWVREMNGSIGIATDAQHVMEYRRCLINVDMMIIEELNELFMGVF